MWKFAGVFIKSLQALLYYQQKFPYSQCYIKLTIGDLPLENNIEYILLVEVFISCRKIQEQILQKYFCPKILKSLLEILD